MRNSLLLALFLGVLGGRAIFANDEKAPTAKQVECTVRVCQGDPLGNEKKGNLKVVSRPRLVVLEDQIGSAFSGSQIVVPDGPTGIEFVEIGHKVEIRTGKVNRGEIHLDITYTSSTAEDPNPERLRVRTESARAIGTYKLGEVVKLPLGPRQADQQEWIEVVVQVIKR